VNGGANATFPWLYLDSNNFYINSTLGSDAGVYIFVTTWTTIDIHGVTATASGTFTATIICKLSSVSPVNVLPSSYTYFLGSPIYFLNVWGYNYIDWVEVPACNVIASDYPTYVDNIAIANSDFSPWLDEFKNGTFKILTSN